MSDLGGFIFGMGGLILLVIVVLWAVYALVTVNRRKNTADPETILKERYARGELSEQEYREMRSELEQ